MRLAFFSDDARWADIRAKAAFTARTLLAMVISLFLSFHLQLQSPMSSVTTVMIVANPMVGALVSKSIWRLIGTVIGGVIGIALMSLFAQSPVLYILVLSVIVGISCMIASFLRLFRAYAAVLTGYTIMIISMPSFNDPDTIFLSALSRFSSLAIGIIVTAAVFMSTSPRRPERVVRQIAQTVRAAIGQAYLFHRTHGEQRPEEASVKDMGDSFRGIQRQFYEGRDKLLAQITGLSSTVEYAATDDEEIRHHVRAFRAGLSRLSGFIASHHPHWRNIAYASPLRASLHEWMADLMADLKTLTADPDWLTHTAPVVRRLDEALVEIGNREIAIGEADDVAVLTAVENMKDTLLQLKQMIHNFAMDEIPSRDERLAIYLDWTTAFRNGARGCLITGLAGMMWYVLRWTSGPLFLLYVVSASSLLSTTPSASRASRPMAIGTALAVPFGLLAHTLILPQIDGFPLLCFMLCVFLMPGVWMQFSPRFGLVAFGYDVFFTILLSISNPIHYDDISLFNNWVAILIGAALLVIVFRVVLPPDDRMDAAHLVASIAQSTRRLALAPLRSRITWVWWENLQIQKAVRLLMRLSLAGGQLDRTEYADAALANLSMGRLIVRLRNIARQGDLSVEARDLVLEALESFKTLRKDPYETAQRLETLAQNLRHQAPEMTLDVGRSIGAMEQAAYIIRSIPGFFHRHGPLQLMSEMRASANKLSMPVPALSLFLGLHRSRR